MLASQAAGGEESPGEEGPGVPLRGAGSGIWNAGELGQGRAFLSSLVVPGLAQYRLGERRWIAYAATEVLAAVLHLRYRGDALRGRSAYRDFAWESARKGQSAGPRMDGDFGYYEKMSQWDASGAWDADASLPGLQPETDPATYNGSVWTLALEIFPLDPARALEFYRERGYGAGFLWAWQSGSSDRSRFGALISESDGRFKDARRVLWVLAANHLFSAVDGLVTVRLRIPPAGGQTELVVTAFAH